MNIRKIMKRTNNLTPDEIQQLLDGIILVKTIEGCPRRLFRDDENDIRCFINHEPIYFTAGTMCDLFCQLVEKGQSMKIRYMLFRAPDGEYHIMIISILAPYRAVRYVDCGLEAIEKLYFQKLESEAACIA